MIRIVLLVTTLITLATSHSTLRSIPHSVYGCYHGNEGTFFWSTKDKVLRLSITSHLTETEWVGIGLSIDEKMGNDDVVAIYKNQTSGLFTAAALFNPHDTSTTMFQTNDSIMTKSVVFEDGEVVANITKSIPLSYPTSDLDITPVYIFFGKGRINSDNPTTPLHKHYYNPTISRSPIALHVKMLHCITTKTPVLIKLHGFVMVCVWLNLSLMAMFLARYTKYFFKASSLWFTMHRAIGVISGVAVIVAVVLAYVGVKMEFELERHQIIGAALCLVMSGHVILALCKPGKDAKHRKMWEYTHKTAALILQCMGVWNIVSGLYMLKVHPICYACITLQIIYYCLLFIVMENPMQLRTCTKCLRRNTGYFSLNATYHPREDGILYDHDDPDDSDVGDITMMRMNVEQPTARVDVTKYGMYGLICINTLSTVVIGFSLAMT